MGGLVNPTSLRSTALPTNPDYSVNLSEVLRIDYRWGPIRSDSIVKVPVFPDSRLLAVSQVFKALGCTSLSLGRQAREVR